jgi:hypothetical protein
MGTEKIQLKTTAISKKKIIFTNEFDEKFVEIKKDINEFSYGYAEPEIEAIK